jgi:hypothetical protein
MRTDPQDEQQHRAAASRRLADTLQQHGIAPHRPAPLAFGFAAGLALGLGFGLLIGWLIWG